MSTSLTAAQFDIEHVADDEPENPEPYWHVQQLLVSELAVTVSRGVRPWFGLEAQLPVRVVRDRVHYLDLERQPYTPPNPGNHHRNETLVGVADPQLTAHFAREGTRWAVAGRLGLSFPVGRTEPNPFALGHLGLRHQHVQFGTGTWDPLIGAAVGRAVGAFELQWSGLARLTFAENHHGYRAGNRYASRLGATRRVGKTWNVETGLLFAKEETEEWDGHVETEGNLGRRDLFLSLGAARAVPSVGTLSASLLVPIASEATGDQVDIPLIFTLGWSR